MQNSLVLTLVLAASSTAALAQSPDPAATQSQPAPIVRSNPNSSGPDQYSGGSTSGYEAPTPGQVTNSQPIPGVLLRVPSGNSVQTISADAKGTELRIDHGVANISVRHPEHNVEILVDLPGGQTSLLKDGLYTFNADTVRVLKGEAAIYPGPANSTSGAKEIKLKEGHELNFTTTANGLRSVEINDPRQLTADLLPSSDGSPRGNGSPARGYGYGPYGDGYAYGYPYPYYPSYPYRWGYGYPYYGYGFGLGFGYYGGFRGYRGGFGGFRGRR